MARKKTKKGRTLIGYVLDSSSSMNVVREAVPNMFNEYVDGQKKIKGEVLFTLTTFNSNFDTPIKNVALNEVPVMTTDNQSGFVARQVIAATKFSPFIPVLPMPRTHSSLVYRPYGSTALYDAIGKTVNELEREAKKSDKVLVVIHTDGYENSSREFTSAQIHAMIERLDTDDSNWTFVFLGSGLDAQTAGVDIGIRLANTYNHSHDQSGIHNAMASLSANTGLLRGGSARKLVSYVDPNLGRAQAETTTATVSKPTKKKKDV